MTQTTGPQRFCFYPRFRDIILYHSAPSLQSFSHNGYFSIPLIHQIHPHLRAFHLPFPLWNDFPSDLCLGGFFSSFKAQCKFYFLRAVFPDHPSEIAPPISDHSLSHFFILLSSKHFLLPGIILLIQLFACLLSYSPY